MDIGETGLRAQMAWFGLLAGAGFPRLDLPDGIAVATRLASNADNGAVLGPACPAVEDAVMWLAAQSVPASVILTGPPEDTRVARLATLGLEPDHGGNEMGSTLRGLSVPDDLPPGVVIEEVTEKTALSDALGVFQQDGWFEDGELAKRATVAERIGYGPASPVRHWIARLGENSVGAATSFVFGNRNQRTVALMHCCVARPYRRRGIATALTQIRLDAARRDGAQQAVLSPSPDGYHLHNASGFLLAPTPHHRWFYLKT